MNICPVCQTQNNHLTVVCISCGSYIQSKVDTLDLFATIWQLAESPRSAFHRIAIASHKNYILFLSAVTGIAFAFTFFWIIKVGNMDIPLLNLLVVGFLIGPVLGIMNLLIIGLIQKIIASLFKLQTRYKNVLAIVAYSSVPIVLSVVFVLPIEVLTFGKFFFSTNPSPFTLKPVSYILILGLDGLSVLWSFILYVYGIKILYDIPIYRAIFISSFTLGIFSLIVFLGIMVLAAQRFESSAEKYFTRDSMLSFDRTGIYG